MKPTAEIVAAARRLAAAIDQLSAAEEEFEHAQAGLFTAVEHAAAGYQEEGTNGSAT